MHDEPDDFVIDTDPARLDVDVIHGYLSRDSYWAAGIPRDVVERSIRNSLAFGVYRSDDGRQVGFARVITDRATFAYLADVFILPGFQGRGLGKRLVDAILAHPELQALRRWMLGTKDAHGLYRRAGFTPLADPAMMMERRDPGLYERMQAATAAEGATS